MAEERNNEISELLDKLREKTVAEAVPERKKSSKKQNMTDDDVKTLLRKYFDDIEPPTGGEPASEEKTSEPINLFDLDTSDFVTEEDEPEPIEETAEEAEFKDETAEESVEDEPAEDEIEVEPVDEDADNEPLTAEDIEQLDDGEPPFDLDEPWDELEPEIEQALEDELVEATVDEAIDASEDEPERTEEEPEEEVEEEILVDELAELDELDDSDDMGELYETDDFVDEEPEPSQDAEDDIIYDYVHPEGAAEDEPEAELDESEPEPMLEEAPEEVEEILVGEPEDTGDISYDNVGDADIDVMVALGFGDKIKEKFGDERIMRAARNIKKNSERLESERAFGYIGEEYTSHTQDERIRESFDRDRRHLTVRLCITAAMSMLLLIYENASIFGIALSGIFDMMKYPAAYTMISLQLLVLCALPSWRNLYDGLLGLLNQKPTARTLLCAALGVITLCDIVIAIVSPAEGVVLFGFPISLGFVFSVLAEYLDYLREKRTFKLISSDDEKFVLTETGVTNDGRVVLSAEKTKFVSGYFERSGRHEPNTSFMIFSVVPLISLGVVLAVVSAAMGQGVSAAIGIFAGVFAFGVPLTQIVGIALSEFGISASLRADAAVIGNSVPDEYSEAAVISLDDTLAFPNGSATVSAIKIYNNNDIYRTLYNISALYSVAGGPLRAAFAESTENLGVPRSVALGEYGTDFISATVDGDVNVCAGSRAALALRGIALPKKDNFADGNTLVYVAVGGKLAASVAAKYELSREFIAVQRRLSAEGVAVRLRSLDPAINEELTKKLCSEGEPIEVSKEQNRVAATECAEAGVVSKNGTFGLIKPFVLRRRARNSMRTFRTVRYIETAACAAFAAALMLLSMRVGLSALAGLCQLVCFGIVTVAFAAMRKNNTKF